jgi:hypothetical protein
MRSLGLALVVVPLALFAAPASAAVIEFEYHVGRRARTTTSSRRT